MQENRRVMVGLFVLAAIALGYMASCGGGGGGGGSTPPVANAGSDQNVLAGSSVALDGSGSSNASAYSWSFVQWPGADAPILLSSTVSKPTFTAATAGIYTLSLLVSNGTVTSSDTVTVTAVNQAAIPDTGQTLCYLANGAPTSCSNSGQDGEYNLFSQPSYSDNGDETITDNVTGLVWQKCTMGESGAGCGTPGVYNWYTASGTFDLVSNQSSTDACGDLTLGNKSDWRLPTDFELMTLIDYSGTYSPFAINTSYFPNMLTGLYWSSTTKASMLPMTSAWYVMFTTDAPVGTFLKTDTGWVRCVRGGPYARVFQDNGNETVKDLAAGLMWQKQDDGTQRTWTNAMSYCEGLSLGGQSDWRLPNVKELRSIVDSANRNPAVNQTYFPGTKTSTYWSSTTYWTSTSTNQAWAIEFAAGATQVIYKSNTYYSYARCVRNLP